MLEQDGWYFRFGDKIFLNHLYTHNICIFSDTLLFILYGLYIMLRLGRYWC